jgi:type I restriction enzyme S subunit
MSSNWSLVRIDKILQLQRRWVQLEPLKQYQEIGLRSFGKGIFHKTPVYGADLGNKRVLEIHPGDLVFSNVFAWEGAVGVATEAEIGMIGSHRFVTYTPVENSCSVEYLQLFFHSPEGLEVVRKVSPGSAGRNRTLNLKQFDQAMIPLPPITEQRRIVARIEELAAKIEEARGLREGAIQQSQSLVTSLHLSLSGSRTVELNQVINLDERQEEVVYGKDFLQVGVRGFGGGLFAKESVDSTQTTYRAFNQLYDGALVLSQVKGWEGAIAVCPSNLSGRYVSPEYRTFSCILRQCYTRLFSFLGSYTLVLEAT